MTLITYPLRIHFADGVLEEALRSEMEQRHLSAPLILADEAVSDTEFTERLYASFPRRTHPIHFPIPASASKKAVAHDVQGLMKRRKADVLIAYGSARAIGLGRKCRHVLWAASDGAPPLELFAIPGIDGLPNPCRALQTGGQALFDPATKSGLPSLLICDPTLTMGVGQYETASAAVTTLVRCLEAYLSDAYNPLADGMALDGFVRMVASLHAVLAHDALSLRREHMAACLNAALAQQKGLGLALTIGEALGDVTRRSLDPGATARLVIPGALKAQRAAAVKEMAIRKFMDVPEGVPLAEAVRAFLAELPLSQSLSDLGVTQADVDMAARDISERGTLGARPTTGALQKIMEDVL